MIRSSFGAWGRCALAASVMMAVVTIAPLREAMSFKNSSYSAGMNAVDSAKAAEAMPALPDEGPMPDIGAASGARSTELQMTKNVICPRVPTALIHGPLTNASLRGKVVLVLPYLKAWAAKYENAGLVVIGVHAPEFSFERERKNVASAVRAYGVTYPVATDSSYAISRAFDNEYWPADYFIDGKSRIRHHHFGEGDYAESERIIQELLKQNGSGGLGRSAVHVAGQGVEAPAGDDQQSPETYVGARRAERFASPESLVEQSTHTYTVPESMALNQWALGGAWDVGAQSAMLQAAPGKIAFRFDSRDLHVVLGPAMIARPVRYKVTLDGARPETTVASIAARAARAKCASRVSISSLAKRVKLKIATSRFNSSIGAYRDTCSRSVRTKFHYRRIRFMHGGR